MLIGSGSVLWPPWAGKLVTSGDKPGNVEGLSAAAFGIEELEGVM